MTTCTVTSERSSWQVSNLCSSMHRNCKTRARRYYEISLPFWFLSGSPAPRLLTSGSFFISFLDLLYDNSPLYLGNGNLGLGHGLDNLGLGLGNLGLGLGSSLLYLGSRRLGLDLGLESMLLYEFNRTFQSGLLGSLGRRLCSDLFLQVVDFHFLVRILILLCQFGDGDFLLHSRLQCQGLCWVCHTMFELGL